MYIPEQMAIDSHNEQLRVIADHGFALLVSSDLSLTHLPLVYEADERSQGHLLGHFARANRHWKSIDGEQVAAVFSGPHAYISPAWYAHGPAVPTWNYVAVHVHGRLRIVDGDETDRILDRMLAHFEPELLIDRAIVTPEIQRQMRGAIVGFRIVIDRIEGKRKLGQQRSSDDQRGVVAGLRNSGRREAADLLDYMSHTGLGLGTSNR